MIRINLIPYRLARRQQQIIWHVSSFFAVITVAGLLGLAAHTVASIQLSDLKEESIIIQQQNAALKKKIGKIKNLDSLRADVERKLELVDRLQEGRFRSLKTLNAIASIIPENVWLDVIADHGGDIELSGMGESNRAVASFMRRLDQSADFTDVRLGEINRVVVDGLPMRRFSLSLSRVGKVPVKTSPTSTSSREMERNPDV
ncbi:MAG: PilN domain-containing protein [Mariprofundus sp.]|nr:PilN domain-containing protein [Mariprofundus sp.]